MPTPCNLIVHLAPVPNAMPLPRLIHAVRRVHTHVVRHVIHHARQASHLAHLAAPAGPATDGACHLAVKLAALGLFALAPPQEDARLVPVETAMQQSADGAAPPVIAGTGVSFGERSRVRANLRGSKILFSPLTPLGMVRPPLGLSDVRRRYIAASGGFRFRVDPSGPHAPPVPPFTVRAGAVPLPEPEASIILAASAATVALLRVSRRGPCRNRFAGA